MTPEERIAELERKIELLETVMKVQATSIEILVPVNVKSRLFVNGATIMSGSGNPGSSPGYPARQGSLFLRNDGSTGTCLYVKESASDTGWSATA